MWRNSTITTGLWKVVSKWKYLLNPFKEKAARIWKFSWTIRTWAYHRVHVGLSPDDVVVMVDDHWPTENMQVLHDVLLNVRKCWDVSVKTCRTHPDWVCAKTKTPEWLTQTHPCCYKQSIWCFGQRSSPCQSGRWRLAPAWRHSHQVPSASQSLWLRFPHYVSMLTKTVKEQSFY